ncbi:MAG: ferritin-like domain-containing protein [Solirubrobacteraceae bacterium]
MSPEGGPSRRALLGSVAAGAAALAGCGRSAATGHEAVRHLAPEVMRRDVAILGRALELERRTVAAYTACIPLLSHDEAKTAEQFLNEELQHTGELISLITAAGARAAPRAASYEIGDPRDGPEVLTLLHSLEAQQIAFYLQWLPQLSPAPVRAAVATILNVDAQHIVVLRLAQGKVPAPSAFVTGAE